MTSNPTSQPSPAIVRRQVTTCVHRTLADLLGVDESILEPDLSLADDLAVDSMELLEVALALETRSTSRCPSGASTAWSPADSSSTWCRRS